MEEELGKVDRDQLQKLWMKLKANEVSVRQKNQPNRPPTISIDKTSPYVRSALSIAQKLTNSKEKSVDFHLEGLIRYGFTRDEVEVILRTAEFGDHDVLLNLASYDKIMHEMTIEDVLTVFTLFLETPSLPTSFRVLLDYRAANIIVSRAKIRASLFPVGSVNPNSIKLDWECLLEKWINHSYTRDHVRLILRNVDIDAEELQEVLKIYDKLDRMRLNLNEAPENKALDNSNAIIEDEIKKARDIHDQASVDSKEAAGKWIKLFKRWIFLDFSREQIQLIFHRVFLNEEEVSKYMTYIDKIVGRDPGHSSPHENVK